MPAVLAILCLILLSACPGAAADHERLGDRAYREERYGDVNVRRVKIVQVKPD